jgi:iduronate 2-sulfatase
MKLWSKIGIRTFFWVTVWFATLPQAKAQHKKPLNVIFICIDDLRPELKCFGADYIKSPNIDRLASQGISFLNHYVNAPSCGPSRCTLLTGRYGPAGNEALFEQANKIIKGKSDGIYASMPEWFKSKGYTTVSVGKVSHHPGGMGGEDWDDSTELEMPAAWDRYLIPVGAWKHPRGVMHGLANGEIRVKQSNMDVFQSAEGNDDIYQDGAITEEGLRQLKLLSAPQSKPFFLAIGIIKPHLPFGAPKSYYDMYRNVQLPLIQHPQKPEGKTTWHSSGEFMGYNHWKKDPNTDAAFADEVRRHYAACVSYADTQVGKILAELKHSGLLENTIVVLWGDHGWHLGEHAIWGKHSLFDEALRSPLIIAYPKMKNKGVKTGAMVTTLDIFPTLCELAGIEKPSFAEGVALAPILNNPKQAGHSVFSYWEGNSTIRTATHRLVLHKDGYVELYDERSPAGETKNIAIQYPDLAEKLTLELIQTLKSK